MKIVRLNHWFVGAVLVLGCAALVASDARAGQWIVHEWGTFTTLQDERGVELPGVNVDDEPVPKFVHNLARGILQPEFLRSNDWLYRQKGVPSRHPLVTMRLETPVIYFYPPPGLPLPARFDVQVRFRGGWLTEFYPQAKATAPGIQDKQRQFGVLTEQTESTLAWNDLAIGTTGQGPVTTEPVWLAPRKVAAANVTSREGESERYLFYRGVAKRQAPLRVSTDRETGKLAIRANFQEVLADGAKAHVSRLWLAHIRGDGASAFRALDGFDVTSDRGPVLATTDAEFPADQFASGNLSRLKAEMHAELVAQGLFADEATALLATWDRAYFQSPGLRLFCVTPRVWTDHYLPLTLSQNAKVERVIIARIELIHHEQRAMLDKLGRMTISDPRWILKIEDEAVRDRLLAGRTIGVAPGVAIPADYRLFLDLGRFRNALLLAAERQHPAGGPYTAFVNNYGLDYYRTE